MFDKFGKFCSGGRFVVLKGEDNDPGSSVIEVASVELPRDKINLVTQWRHMGCHKVTEDLREVRGGLRKCRGDYGSRR